MDKAALVATDFAVGAEIAKALDQSTLSISVAMWIYLEYYDDWRFLVASPRLDEAQGVPAYGLVHDALAAAGISMVRIPTLMIRRMSDPLIRELRRRFSKMKNIEGMRLGLEQIGNQVVESAIVYRIR